MGLFDGGGISIAKRSFDRSGTPSLFGSVLKDLTGGNRKKKVRVPGSGVAKAKDLGKEAKSLQSEIQSSKLSQQTSSELLSRLSGDVPKNLDVYAKNIGQVRSIFSDIALGDQTALGRRENLRIRTEIAQDRPGRRGLFGGR
jgi:hypothetical protein